MGPCMCGDTECPSCGTAQGTFGLEDVSTASMSIQERVAMLGILVHTDNVCPPVPSRDMDWTAYDDHTYDGPGSFIGRGATEEEAILDLLEQMENM